MSSSPRKFLLNKSLHRRTQSDQPVTPSSGEKSPRRKNSDGTTPQGNVEAKQAMENLQSTPDKAEKLGHFHSIPHMMKLYEITKGAYKTYQVTLYKLYDMPRHLHIRSSNLYERRILFSEIILYHFLFKN